MAEWHKVEEVALSDSWTTQLQEVTAGGKRLCLLRKGDLIYAFAATCPHAGARLCEGWVDAPGRVVCPLHGYRFDPANGRNTSGEGYKLKTFPLEVRENSIFVSF